MRTRLLHPEFFSDPTLAALSDFTRLVFAGLWLIADREGRLLDSVKMIDGAILPLDARSCAAALNELAAAGRIRRYRTAAGPVIQVVNLLKYQHIHPNEKPSKFPDISLIESAQVPERLRKPTGTNQAVTTSVSTSVSTSDSVSISTSDSKTRAAREESAPTARASDPRGGVHQKQRRRVAAVAHAARGASAPVDEALLAKHFGARRR